MDQRSDRPGWLFTDTLPSSQSATSLFATPDLFDALFVANGPVVCRLVDSDCNPQNRHLMWAFDATLVLNQFANECARSALQAAREATGWQPPAELLQALEVKVKWDAGDATPRDIRAARENAWLCRHHSAHAAPDRDVQATCIDEAKLTVASAVGVPRMECERNNSWKSSHEAFTHCCLTMAAARALKGHPELDPRELRRNLVSLLEQLLVTEMSCNSLREAAAPIRRGFTTGALYAIQGADMAGLPPA